MLSGDQKLRFKYAIRVDGIDEEIAIIRIKFSTLLAQDGNNMNLINQTVKTLGRLYDIKSGHTQDGNQLKAAITAVLSEWEILGTPVKDNAAQPDCKNHES